MGDALPKSSFAVHLCARLTRCDLRELCARREDLPALERELRSLVAEAGFEVVAEAYHFFGPRAVTGTLCLAESHVCFHSWPEENLVYLDIFACARSRDPRRAVEGLLDNLVRNIFKARGVETQWVARA